MFSFAVFPKCWANTRILSFREKLQWKKKKQTAQWMNLWSLTTAIFLFLHVDSSVPYWICANSNGSDLTARMCRLVLAVCCLHIGYSNVPELQIIGHIEGISYFSMKTYVVTPH